MLYWDSSHPTGVTIPLRQPNPPVYYNIPEKESPIMSGSQSPTSEMTIASSSSELSGEETLDPQEEKLNQQMSYLSFNQNMTGHTSNSTPNSQIENQYMKMTSQPYQYSTTQSAYYTWNGNSYDISSCPPQQNGENPSNLRQSQPCHTQYSGQSKPTQVNGHTNLQMAMTGNLNYQITGARSGLTGVSSDMTGTSGNCQIYPQTSQMSAPALLQNNIQVVTSQMTGQTGYPVTSVPTMYQTAVPYTTMTSPASPSVYPACQPVQYVIHYGNQTQPLQPGQYGNQTQPIQPGQHGNQAQPLQPGQYGYNLHHRNALVH